MTETHEMTICFNEMEKLKAKIEALREKIKVEEEKRLLRELTMEPNLKVLKTWLDDYMEANKVAIENKNKKATQELKRITINNIRSIASLIIQQDEEYKKLSDRLKHRRRIHHNKYNNVDFDELDIILASLERDPYNVLLKKKYIVNQLYENGKYVKPAPTNDEVTKANIEATYNMFNNINKRLDDIESKLS
jgi:hypothetical protein